MAHPQSGLLEGLSSGDRTLVTSTEAQNLKTLLRTNVESYYGDWLFPAGMNVCAKTGTGTRIGTSTHARTYTCACAATTTATYT